VKARWAVPAHWNRIEFMDHGIANPCAWYVAATDEAGNLVVFDSYYSPGLVSEHCEAVLARRSAWWPEWTNPDGILEPPSPFTWADPSVRNRTGQSDVNRKWQGETVASEYAKHSDHRITLALANNDPKAGRIRISELLKLEEGRPASYYQVDIASCRTSRSNDATFVPHVSQSALALPRSASRECAGSAVRTAPSGEQRVFAS
jgi:hypothetical protein